MKRLREACTLCSCPCKLGLGMRETSSTRIRLSFCSATVYSLRGPDNTPASNPANSNPPSTVFLNLSRLQSHQHSQDTPIEVRNPFSLSRFVVSGINQDNATPGILRRGHTFHFLYLRLTITTANTFGCQQSHASCTETRRDATVRLRILLYYAL
ncbi:hypothetical protein Moror_2589 [Moniliophthora roreri MCA 2997]|uniref:Uncharacterized protein n=1 Tax=Moniliophthora roreri (strain MCA 2997) TaxID=1381753 RepID=V2XGA3_MONRO|nr:hypothetical protein Moror_2589 [Moniliophthora roreri MCA 2997]